MRNISQNKKRPEAGENPYRTLIDSTIQPILVHRNFRILYANQAYADLIGAPDPATVVDEIDIDSLFLPEDRQLMHEYSSRRLAGETIPTRYEVRNRRLDGEIIWIEVQAVVVDFEGGPAIMTTVVDVTERKRHEQALLQAKTDAEAANRAKSAFLANMSHELRTPLNAILGFTEIMKDEVLGPLGNSRYRGYARDVYDSARHLLDLIDDVLDLSRVEAGRFKLEESTFPILPVFEEAERRARAAGGLARLAIAGPSDALGVSIRADRRAFQQILSNLLSNAVKFTPRDGFILISADLDEECWSMQVTDTGPGIPPDDIGRVQAPFEQVGNVSNRARQGSGLGLSIVKALAELHNGRIQIDSEVDKGTTVSVIFPRVRVVA